jgi:hypothetical protein
MPKPLRTVGRKAEVIACHATRKRDIAPAWSAIRKVKLRNALNRTGNRTKVMLPGTPLSMHNPNLLLVSVCPLSDSEMTVLAISKALVTS